MKRSVHCPACGRRPSERHPCAGKEWSRLSTEDPAVGCEHPIHNSADATILLMRRQAELVQAGKAHHESAMDMIRAFEERGMLEEAQVTRAYTAAFDGLVEALDRPIPDWLRKLL